MKLCNTCEWLRPFELTDELFTCPVVNIRIHATFADIFGCNQHVRRKPVEQRCERTGKVQYASYSAARKTVKGLAGKRKDSGRLHAYQCPDCKCWHVGH